MDKQRKNRRLGLLALVAILTLVLLICVVMIVDAILYPTLPDVDHKGKTLWHNGVSYFPRQDIRVFLLLGIDRSGPVVDSGSYNNPGAADVVLLLVFDETNKQYSVLALNRDTIVEMPVLGLGGKHAGTISGQLALSHTYGNGLKQSCENTRETVSSMLYGAPIHQYISMNMDVISILTNAVGGVKVNVHDDFSMFDDSIQKGEMVLNGDQAYLFVRTRKDVGDQLNVSRMSRHEEFMRGFVEAFHTNIGSDIDKAMEVYESISQYVVSDCSDQMMVELLERFYNYDFVDVLTPPGTNIAGEKYMEFYLDEEKYIELIISLLFSPKNK